MRSSTPIVFRLYVGLVTVLAGWALWSFAATVPQPAEPFGTAVFWLLLVITVATEVAPLRVPMGDEEVDFTISTTFGFTSILALGPLPGAATLITAAVVADLLARKAPAKLLFNAGQYTLAVAAAAAVIDASGTWFAGADVSSLTALVSAVIAGAAFAVVNISLMTGALVAAGHRRGNKSALRSFLQILTRDLRLTAWASTILASLAPIVALAALASVWVVPLLLVPVVALYQSVAIYLDRERHLIRDRLTGLPNRILFEDRVRQAVLSAGDSHRSAAVLVLNVDAFREINAALGYDTGDEILQRLARRLRRELDDSDTLARLEADEFGVVVSGLGDEKVAERVVDRLRAAVARPFALPSGSIAVEASVGGATSPEHGTEPLDLIAAADRAMGEAKRLRLGHQWAAPVSHAPGAGRMRMLAELRVAIDEGHLELHYQPKARLPGGAVAGLEALVRWRRADGDLVPPARFLPVAEDTGLIGDLTRYVIADAVQQMRRWQDAGTPIAVAVNISARDLQDATLAAYVEATLRRHGVAPASLELEVTESSIMADVGTAVETLSALRRVGVRLAIDDFGTGNTSLAQLPRLPVDVLKIDRSFVERLEHRPEDLIVRTTIDLGRGLGFAVVAEGVSSAVIRDRVADMGCDYAQGFFYSRPVPVEEVDKLVAGVVADS